MMPFLAQFVVAGGLGYWLILAIVVAGLIAIAVVVLKQLGVSFPPWVIQIFWIVLTVIVGVVALKILISMF